MSLGDHYTRLGSCGGEAGEFLLRRKLYRRLRDDSVINPALCSCITRSP